MVGAVVSRTVTVCVAVAVLPAASLAVQTTVVLPSGNVDGALLVAATVPSRASTATAVPMETAVRAPVASAVTSGGAFMRGGVLSGGIVTVTANDVLADKEPAVAVTVMVYLPAADEAAGLTVTVPLPLPPSERETKPGLPDMESRMASPSGSDAVTCRVSVAPCASVTSCMTDMDGARSGRGMGGAVAEVPLCSMAPPPRSTVRPVYVTFTAAS